MPQKKQTLAELANSQLAKQSGGQQAADALDEGKRQARILHQMRENKNTMSQSVVALDGEMRSGSMSMYGDFARVSSKRRSSIGINSESQEKTANRMRDFQQNASASQSNDLHARLCAENILRSNEMDPEVDISDKPNISVRQLLTIDDRCAGVHVRDAQFGGRVEKKDGDGDGMEFTSGLKKRNILSWRSLGRQV
jgi:hypothetical protein